MSPSLTDRRRLFGGGGGYAVVVSVSGGRLRVPGNSGPRAAAMSAKEVEWFRGTYTFTWWTAETFDDYSRKIYPAGPANA